MHNIARSALRPLALGILLACSVNSLAETPTSREIYLPFEELANLTGSPGRRVLLERDAYEALLKQVQPKKTESAPHDVVLLSANYDLTIVDGR
ncbi:MAG TPA: hypothetical protein VHY20_07460, partial [Pirellulales bacterium]|nr:hypothetical protein [Pirellulales bacterium]